LDIKIRYNHKKALAIVNMNKSERKPKLNILKVSINENEACVIG
jgi:hypothetical protein